MTDWRRRHHDLQQLDRAKQALAAARRHAERDDRRLAGLSVGEPRNRAERRAQARRRHRGK